MARPKSRVPCCESLKLYQIIGALRTAPEPAHKKLFNCWVFTSTLAPIISQIRSLISVSRVSCDVIVSGTCNTPHYTRPGNRESSLAPQSIISAAVAAGYVQMSLDRRTNYIWISVSGSLGNGSTSSLDEQSDSYFGILYHCWIVLGDLLSFC